LIRIYVILKASPSPLWGFRFAPELSATFPFAPTGVASSLSLRRRLF
jgi:hypothetical protein